MKYRIVATEEQLAEVGLNYLPTKVGIKVAEFWDGYYVIFCQWYSNEYYYSYDYHVPKEYLELIEE